MRATSLLYRIVTIVLPNKWNSVSQYTHLPPKHQRYSKKPDNHDDSDKGTPFSSRRYRTPAEWGIICRQASPAGEGREPSLCGVITQGRRSSNLHPSEDRLAGSPDSKGPVRGFAYLNYMMFYILAKRLARWFGLISESPSSWRTDEGLCWDYRLLTILLSVSPSKVKEL